MYGKIYYLMFVKLIRFIRFEKLLIVCTFIFVVINWESVGKRNPNYNFKQTFNLVPFSTLSQPIVNALDKLENGDGV